MHTPDQLQAGIQAIADALAEAVRAKGYPEGHARIEIKSAPRDVWIWIGGFPNCGQARFVYADTLDEAINKARDRIANLPSQPTQEQIGRTLGIIQEDAA